MWHDGVFILVFCKFTHYVVLERANMYHSQLHSLKESHTKFIALLEDLKSRHDVSQLQQLQDKIMAYETKCEELDNSLADARFDLQKSESRCDRLEVQLSDAIDDLRSGGGAVVAGPSEKASSPVSSSAKTENTEKTLPIEEVRLPMTSS